MFDSSILKDVNSLSLRLKVLQKDLADKSVHERKRIFQDEIHSAVKNIPPESYDTFMELLEKRFPSFKESPYNKTVEVAAPAKTDFSTQELVSMLKKKLEGEEQATIDRVLAPLGVSSAKQEKVESNDKDSELAAALIDCLKTIDKQLWTVLQDFSNYANNRSLRHDHRCDFEVLHAFRNTDKISNAELNGQLSKFRRLVATLIFTLENFPEIFYDSYMKPLEPAMIEKSAGKGGIFKAKEASMWEKYTYLAQSLLERNAFKVNVKTSIANSVNDSVKKLSK